MKSPYYFDYAAATPVNTQVLKAMQPFWQEQFYNPSSLYEPARKVKAALETARGRVALALGIKPQEVVFTAGATESINLAIGGVLRAFPGNKVLISSIEHEAVTASAELHARANQVIKAPVETSGLVDTQKLRNLINDDVVLISVMYANNEFGAIQPIRRIAALLKELRADRLQRQVKLPLYFHTDASQAANYLDLSVNRLGVDLLTLNGSKIYGPKQTGCLYIRSNTHLKPVLGGGGQEKGWRSGTENVTGSIGFALALELAVQSRQAESQRLTLLRDYFFENIIKVSGVRINGTLTSRLPNNINLSVPGIDGETLVHYLNAAGILAATGAACSANKETTSAALLALGLSAAEANGSLRLSLGRGTTKEAVEHLLKVLTRVISQLSQQG